MARVGIFGGTFDPVHVGHKSLADNIKQKKRLDKVLIIPTNQPPHKPNQHLLENEHRLAMCKLVFTPEEGYEVSNLEFKLGGNSYTVHTLEHLRQQYPNDQLFLIIGSDMLYTFELWKDYKKIMDMATVLAGARNKDEYSSMIGKAEWLAKQGGSVEVVPVDVISISSTDIRRDSETESRYIDSKVADYIKQNGLYGLNLLDIETAREIAKQNLTPDRYYHSECVAKEAVKLAEQYGADPEKAELAGILHDVMKNKDENYLLQYFSCNGIILTDIEKKIPKLWHTIAGAVFAQQEFKIDDQDIINAIRYHTTARKNMSLLEKVIFVADCNSADRIHEVVDESRKMAEKDLDHCILYNLQQNMIILLNNEMHLHPDCVQAYNSLLKIKSEEIDG